MAKWKYFSNRDSLSSEFKSILKKWELQDIEEIHKFGTENSICPYYLNLDKLDDAELVLLPYNYLIDPSIRDRMNINLTNSVVIIDEAHNIDSVWEENASIDITEFSLNAMWTEIKELIASIAKNVKFFAYNLANSCI